MQLKSGTLLQNGKYRIEKVLGQGGFGITYLAVQTSLDRKVAIKEFFMKDYCNRDSDTSHVSVPSIGSKELVFKFRNKFIREAKMIAAMENPHIVTIYEVFEENGTAYYVMQYVEGGSLESKVPIKPDEAEIYIRQIADALDCCHDQKILHLDVKPSNVMLNKGKAVLIDFGISKHYDEGGDQTSSTPVGISKGYAPLEQYDRGDISSFTPCTDIYSLGATFYKLLTGQTPPEANKVNEEGIHIPDNIPMNQRNAISFAMQPKRKDRPQSVEEFLAILDSKTSLKEDTYVEVKVDPVPEPAPVPGPTPTPVPDPNPRGKWIILLILSVILGFGGYYAYEVIENNRTHGSINGHDWVDLGLSVKWATSNVGAESPEDYGNYYAWGETSTKSEYTKDNSKTYDKQMNDIGGRSQYDAARANWGGSWRLPTKAELEELKNKCTWNWTTQNGVKGCKVTGPNGNHIFLPAAGYRAGSSLLNAGEHGHYWSSTPDESYSYGADNLYFNSGNQSVYWYYRDYGRSVRPVSE